MPQFNFVTKNGVPRTDSYVATLDLAQTADLQWLENYRWSIRERNKARVNKDTRWSVELKHRVAPEFSHLYRNKYNTRVREEHASHTDVYLHEKRTEAYWKWAAERVAFREGPR